MSKLHYVYLRALHYYDKYLFKDSLDFIVTKQTDYCQRGGRLGGWVRKVKKLSKNKERLMNTDNSMVIVRGKAVWEEVEEGKGEINGDGK